METEPTQDPARDQTVDIIHPTSYHKQGEELDCHSKSQDLEQQDHISEHHETEDEDANKETEEQVEHAAVEENLTEMQKDADADTNTEVETEVSVDPREEQVIQADVTLEESAGTDDVQQASETTNETCFESEMDSKVEASAVKDPTAETETQQQQEEVITERDKTLQGKYHSAESLTETDTNEESRTQSETETDVLAQTQEQAEANAAAREESEGETDQTDSEQHVESKTEDETLTLCSPECIQTNESTDLVGDTETEEEMPVAGDMVTASSEEKELDTEASEPAQETEEGVLTAHSEVQVDNEETQAEETPIESQRNVESADSIAPPQKEANSTHDEEVNPTTETDGNISSVEVSTSEEPVPEQANIQVTMGAVEEERSTENVKENATGEDDVFVSTEPTDPPNTDSTPQDSHPAKDRTEPNNSGLIQAVGRRSSRSSADFCVRKSSSSRGSRLGRRLSEDLFIVPQKDSQSQSVPDHADVKQSNPADVSPTQTPPNATPEVTTSTSAEVTERTAEQPEPDRPKRFGLFRRLRGEQPKNAKAKGAPKMQVPKILIQDFSDGTGSGKLVEEEVEEKLSSRERRRRRRERERKEKEEEKSRKKREKDLERERERERRKPQTRGKSFQASKDGK
ncbi:hypothetical protein L3Q82_005734 [Scortum barcoo]|uniref:Uncharacterized protein n=1 Tax=Scortum barcoo TaxID=214431 RepID=A0ACB8V6B0_9TELE|nr:hypothetical protein L3Q82_005734 [Scortum barcoo]